jgi:ectoine hydroxylase-related dioxygenase (phytanoyl-CoA dioxygenase family)
MVECLAASNEELAQQVCAALQEDGVVVVEDAIGPDMIAHAKSALELGAHEDEANGFQVRGSAYDPDELNIRVRSLPAKDAVFRDMLELPALRAAVTGWLGDNVRLSNFTSNTTLPGAGAMALHADQNNIPAPWPPYPCTLNVAFALDDFTPDNATRYMPGTHRESGPPAWEGTHPDAVPLCGRAGSMIFMEGRTYHQTGHNTGTTPRSGAFAFFAHSFLAPQFEWHRAVPRELRATLSPWLREIMGFGQSGGTANFIPKDANATSAASPAR